VGKELRDPCFRASSSRWWRIAVPILLRTWAASMKYAICAVCENVDAGEYGRRKPNPKSAPLDPLAATAAYPFVCSSKAAMASSETGFSGYAAKPLAICLLTI